MTSRNMHTSPPMSTLLPSLRRGPQSSTTSDTRRHTDSLEEAGNLSPPPRVATNATTTKTASGEHGARSRDHRPAQTAAAAFDVLLNDMHLKIPQEGGAENGTLRFMLRGALRGFSFSSEWTTVSPRDSTAVAWRVEPQFRYFPPSDACEDEYLSFECFTTPPISAAVPLTLLGTCRLRVSQLLCAPVGRPVQLPLLGCEGSRQRVVATLYFSNCITEVHRQDVLLRDICIQPNPLSCSAGTSDCCSSPQQQQLYLRVMPRGAAAASPMIAATQCTAERAAWSCVPAVLFAPPPPSEGTAKEDTRGDDAIRCQVLRNLDESSTELILGEFEVFVMPSSDEAHSFHSAVHFTRERDGGAQSCCWARGGIEVLTPATTVAGGAESARQPSASDFVLRPPPPMPSQADIGHSPPPRRAVSSAQTPSPSGGASPVMMADAATQQRELVASIRACLQKIQAEKASVQPQRDTLTTEVQQGDIQASELERELKSLRTEHGELQHELSEVSQRIAQSRATEQHLAVSQRQLLELRDQIHMLREKMRLQVEAEEGDGSAAYVPSDAGAQWLERIDAEIAKCCPI